MTSLITGGSGFLGTYLARALLQSGEAVRLLDPVEPAPDVRGDVEWLASGVLDTERLAAALDGVEVVYHTAALVPLSKAGRGFEDVNVTGTRNVAQAALAAGVRRLVHVSSSAVYDPRTTPMPVSEESPLRPVGDYGRSKLAAEHEVMDAHRMGLDVTVIRPRTIVDEGRGGIFQILFDWAMAGKRLYVIGDGSNTFQLISGRDAASACIAAAGCTRAAGEDFDVGADEYGTLDELMRDLVEHAGSGASVVHLNAGFASTVLAVLDAMHLSPLAEWHYLTMSEPFFYSNRKAEGVLGWRPADSNWAMMSRAYDWYVQHHDEIDKLAGTTHRTSPPQRILGLLRKLS